MPAQTSTTINQKMNDRQPDTESVILSKSFIFVNEKARRCYNTSSLFIKSTVYFSLSTVKYEVDTETPFISMPS